MKIDTSMNTLLTLLFILSNAATLRMIFVVGALKTKNILKAYPCLF